MERTSVWNEGSSFFPPLLSLRLISHLTSFSPPSIHLSLSLLFSLGVLWVAVCGKWRPAGGWSISYDCHTVTTTHINKTTARSSSSSSSTTAFCCPTLFRRLLLLLCGFLSSEHLPPTSHSYSARLCGSFILLTSVTLLPALCLLLVYNSLLLSPTTKMSTQRVHKRMNFLYKFLVKYILLPFSCLFLNVRPIFEPMSHYFVTFGAILCWKWIYKWLPARTSSLCTEFLTIWFEEKLKLSLYMSVKWSKKHL